MKKITKFIIFLLTAVMAVCLCFAVACEDKEIAPEEPATENDASGEDLQDQTGEQDAPSAGPEEDGGAQKEEAKPFERPAPGVSTALFSAVEEIVKNPATFTADLTYGEKVLSGLVYVDLHTEGSLTKISVENAELRASFGDIDLWYDGGCVYAADGDLKISVTLDEIKKLADSFSGSASLKSAGDSDVLAQLLKGDFTFAEDGAQLKSVLFVSGAKVNLTFDFGVGAGNSFDFRKIRAEISLSGEQIEAELKKSDVEAPAALSDKDSFTDIGGYAYDVVNLLKSQYIAAEVEYSDESGLKIGGNLTLNAATLEVSGEFNVEYGKISRAFNAVYKQGFLYVTVDGLKIKLSAEECLNMISSLIPLKGADALTQQAAGDMLSKILTLQPDKYISVTEEDGALALALKGTELLRELGIEFAPGDVNVSVKDGKISASAAGVSVKLGKGARFSENTAGYTDVTDVLLKIPELLDCGAVSLKGGVRITAENTDVSVDLNKAVVSFKDGLQIYLDVTLNSGESAHDILLYITGDFVQLTYGDVGARVEYGELSTIEQALFGAYGKLRALTEKVAGEEYNPLPEIGGIEDLKALFGEGGAAASALGNVTKNLSDFDWTELVQNIRLGANGDGFLHAELGALSLDVCSELDRQGYLGLTVGYGDGKIGISGELHADVCNDGIPAMPGDIEYLGAADFADLIDYAVAAVNTLCREDITLSFRGAVAGKYKNISADLTYHSPAGFPFTLNMAGKSVRFDAATYLSLGLKLEGATSDTESLYLDITVIDGVQGEDGAIVTDGILDFYVSVSRFGSGDNAAAAGGEYKPLLFHATSDEVLTLLSGALVIMGADSGIINDFFITKWITGLDTMAQLKACGNIVKPLLGAIIGGESVSAVQDAGTPLAVDEDPAAIRRGFLKKFACESGRVDIEVDTGAPDGKFTLSLGKTLTQDGEEAITLLTGAAFGYGDGKVAGVIEISYDEVTPAVMEVADGMRMYDFAGADELLLSLARSVTGKKNSSPEEVISGEEEPHEYVVNNYYYIDGTITASFGKIIDGLLGKAAPITIELVAVSVTVNEKGIPAVNIRFKYNGIAVLGIAAINGDSTVDITVKDGMVYMRREQSSYFDGILGERQYGEGKNIVLYRAMPLENFFGDILNQLGFILNFGDLITEQIAKVDTSSDSGSEGGAAAAFKDYGTIVGEVLNAYVCKTSESGAMSWGLYLNGSSFSKGILGEFDIELSEDANGLIRELKVTKCEIIPVKGLTIDATLELVWHNAGGVMAEGVEDNTADVSAVAANSENGMGAMIEKLTAENGWAARKFIEGKPFGVNFVNDLIDGTCQEAGSQNVMVSTGADGFGANVLYGSLAYPETVEDEAVYSVWAEYSAGDVLPTDGKIHAVQNKRIYTVTFYSEEPIEGWNGEPDGRYSYAAEMEYGSKVTFNSLGAQYAEPYIVTGGENVVRVPARPADSNRWAFNIGKTGATFDVLYNRDTVNYRSEIPFAVNGKNYSDYSVQFTEDVYNMITPEAEGYIFLGWFEKTESGWNKVTSVNKGADGPEETTVEALWAKTSGVEFTASRKGFISYTYSASAELNEITFYGSMAEDVKLKSVEYNFNLSDGITLKRNDVRQQGAYEEKFGLLYNRAWVEVTAVYTLGENEISITQQSAEVKW